MCSRCSLSKPPDALPDGTAAARIGPEATPGKRPCAQPPLREHTRLPTASRCNTSAVLELCQRFTNRYGAKR